MSTNNNTTTTAETLLKEAEQKAKLPPSWAFWRSKSLEAEEAAEAFAKAAGQFRIAKKWSEAGQAYQRASDLAIKSQSELMAASYLAEAAKSFAKSSPQDAIRVYGEAATLYMQLNRFSTAARLYQEMGELQEEKEATLPDAINSYLQAADCFLADGANSSQSNLLVKVADIHATHHRYEQAINLYQQVAKSSSEKYRGVFSVTCACLLKAGLCALANALLVSGDVEQVANSIHEYKSVGGFEQSSDCIFLDALVPIVAEGDAEKLSETLETRNRFNKFNAVHLSILNVIKTHLQGVAPSSLGSEFNNDEASVFNPK